MQTVLAYYRRTIPLIAKHFADTVLVYTTYPQGFTGKPRWHGPVPWNLPQDVSTLRVQSSRGSHRYLALSAQQLEWIVCDAQAVEVYGWGCIAKRPERARFARILLELDAREDWQALIDATLTLREQLERMRLRAIPVAAGMQGLALWIPFSDEPEYPPLREWLHGVCAQAVQDRPDRFSTEPNSHAVGRVHLHVDSNAPGRFSTLPYSLRVEDPLHVCAPMTWDEVADMVPFRSDEFAARLDSVGDVFGTQLALIGEQRFAVVRRDMATVLAPEPEHTKDIGPYGHVLRAAIEILQDGQPREAGQILSEAVARKLLPPSTPRKYVYTSLLEYIVRTSGHGHRPAIVQDADRRFRINEPPDEWPVVQPPAAPAVDAQTQALIDRLTRTSRGSDPTAFEIAVCDAFAHLGFAATHVGGQEHPDGYADAQLGALGYRVMIECKTAIGAVSDPDAVEASKYRDGYDAQYCTLVGPAFSEELELASELQTHKVSAWTVDDLRQLLSIGSNPYEMLPLFAPGFASDVLQDVLWSRLHGQAKDVRMVCDYLQEAGWAAQVAAAKHGPPQNAPRLTLDAAMLLVDQRLADMGSAASCTREQVQHAFEYLTNPRVGIAVWADAQVRDAIVIVQQQSAIVNGDSQPGPGRKSDD